MRLLLEVPAKQISKCVPLLTYEWADLKAYAANEMEPVLSTLLRWTPCTYGIIGPADQFRACTDISIISR